ncbi:response regulator [Mucilaginibacter pedocola]|uniref:Transcriptional regulator n=1 Tax=Mucilaginibacter pedocola TaxID=1792845 RepID=A0A1S9PBG0_9SPHI|nr:response regulator [Mucilaginibacter pedocola]OOQ58259.1 transcriptional regulator [Mucilaginibacter pedocola]
MTKVDIACVVDDDEIYTFTVKRIIGRSEIANKTIFFHNGQAALDFFIANAHNAEALPDLILLDINMPVLDGWQFLAEYVKLVPEMGKKITVFIVSSSIDEEDYARARAIEIVSDFIVKPLTVDHLHEILKRVQEAE